MGKKLSEVKRDDFAGDAIRQQHQLPGIEDAIWKEMLDSSKILPNADSPAQFGQPDACKIPNVFVYYCFESLTCKDSYNRSYPASFFNSPRNRFSEVS